MVRSDLQRECEVVSVHEGSQVATVRLDLDGKIVQIGVNLWEVKGYSRKADGFSVDRFIPVGVIK